MGMSVLAAAASLVGAPAARAADGDTLRQITADRGGCGLGTGIAFDGVNLLLSCSYTDRIDVIDPADGHLVESKPIAGISSLGALAWDRGRQKLWACSGFGGDSGGGDEHSVYLIDLATQTAEYRFGSAGCVDGLAYDGSDDSLWTSADVAFVVHHYRADDGFELPDKFSVEGQLGRFPASSGGGGFAAAQEDEGPACGSSGIAVGGPVLLLANNGCS